MNWIPFTWRRAETPIAIGMAIGALANGELMVMCVMVAILMILSLANNDIVVIRRAWTAAAIVVALEYVVLRVIPRMSMLW